MYLPKRKISSESPERLYKEMRHAIAIKRRTGEYSKSIAEIQEEAEWKKLIARTWNE